MSNPIRQSIIDFLLKESGEHGIAVVKDACDSFLKMGLRLGVDQTEPRRFTRAQVKQAWLHQKGRCNRCREPLALDEAVGDHVEPWADGGKTTAGNCAAVHGAKSDKNCNSIKGDKNILADSKRTGNLFSDTLPEEE